MTIKRLLISFGLLTMFSSIATAASFNATQASGGTFSIPDASFDTPAAKEFLKSGKNIYVGDEAGIKAGKKIFSLYSCMACHGG